MKRIRFVIWVLLVCAVFTIQIRSTPSLAEPQEDTAVFDKIDAYVQQKMNVLHIPGLSLGIVMGDRILYLKGYGAADGKGRPVQPQTPFPIGSTSKFCLPNISGPMPLRANEKLNQLAHRQLRIYNRYWHCPAWARQTDIRWAKKSFSVLY